VIIFDCNGVLVDSEQIVAAAKTILTRTVKDKVADNLLVKGIEDFKGKLN